MQLALPIPLYSLLACALAACSASPAATPANASCGGCHPVQSAALAASRHAHATDSDLFTALRARAPAADQAFCDSCHAAHDVPGERGVGCVTCHTAVGNRSVRNAALVFDPGGPQRGPLSNPVTTPGHASAPSGFLASADLCGTCHEVAGPGAFIETPYTEWSTSPAASVGIRCAACHMAASPGDSNAPRPGAPAAVGGPDRALSDHAFVGPDDPRAGELLGRAAALAARLTLSGAGLGVEVTVTNRNAAHALPSGARFAREVWLEVTAHDAAGGDHVVSGGTNSAGLPLATDTQRVDLGDRLAHGGAAALPLDSDPPVVRAIPAGARGVYRFNVPAMWDGAGATTAVRVRLRYRRNATALRVALGLPVDLTDPLTNPLTNPVDLATADVTVPSP